MHAPRFEKETGRMIRHLVRRLAAGALNDSLGTTLFAGGLRFGSAGSKIKI
jgi:hypothetical protein